MQQCSMLSGPAVVKPNSVHISCHAGIVMNLLLRSKTWTSAPQRTLSRLLSGSVRAFDLQWLCARRQQSRKEPRRTPPASEVCCISERFEVNQKVACKIASHKCTLLPQKTLTRWLSSLPDILFAFTWASTFIRLVIGCLFWNVMPSISQHPAWTASQEDKAALSMGYGFLEFESAAQAQDVLRRKQGASCQWSRLRSQYFLAISGGWMFLSRVVCCNIVNIYVYIYI